MNRVTCALLLAVWTMLTAPAAPSATSSRTPPPPPPSAAPERVAATASSGQVVVEWTAVSGATRYHVFRSVSGVWDAAPLARVTGKYFKNAGLTNGTTYSYRVGAANNGGTGPVSAVVSATPLGPPTDFAAAAGDTKVTLTWTASPGASTYTVYRGTSWHSSAMTSVGTGITQLTFVDTGLTNGTTYYYRAQTHAGTSASPLSRSVSAKPLPPPPSTAPENLTATIGHTKVTLTWSAVDGVIGYRIYRTTTGVWDRKSIASVTGTKYRDINLTNGTAYSYKVAAYNRGGTGPLSAAVTATPLAPPPAPVSLSAAPGDGLITLAWAAVPDVTGYNVYRGTSPNRQATVAIATGLTSPTFVNRDLQNGLTYYYRATAVNGGGESPRSDEVSASPESPPVAPNAETIDAFHFLRHATWGPKPGDVEALKALEGGKAAFVDGQLAAPASTLPNALFGRPLDDAQEYFMSLALTGQDQLRQRVAWALHKIWVVSAVEVASTRAIVTYYRILQNGAFGNYRDLMRDVTLNPAMGQYLNMLNSRSEALTGTPPNENYARELMQLFTLGIPTLNPDGTPIQGAAPAYTEQDVRELSRILTGWTFGDGNPATIPRGAGSESFTVPMEAVERRTRDGRPLTPGYHDTGAKTFLGHVFPAGQSSLQDLDQALDILFNHPNLATFVSRQLIQQLVTSNPSPGYVRAIANVFVGTGGNLGAVVRAILLHDEASSATPTSGKLAEPVLFVVSMLRALNASVTDHPFMSNKTEAMGQKVFYPPSVFSYFSPGYRVRGTRGASGAPLGGPEFQILTTVTALERANFVGDLLGGRYGTDVTIDYTPFTNLAVDPGALTDYCNLLLMGGRMSLEQRAEIVNAIKVTPPTSRRERVRTALYITLTAAQSQVDR